MGEREERRARFERLYGRASPQVLGYALRRAGSPEDGDQGRLWLYGVARRVLANQRRGRQRRERLEARLRDEVAVVGARASTGRPAPDSAVMAALARLDEADRELVTLVAWEHLDRDQIAAMLGCSRATVRVGCTGPGAASPGCWARKGTSSPPSRSPPSAAGTSTSAP